MMVLVTKIEIICTQFDKTAIKNGKGNHPVLERHFFSCDSKNNPRFFDNVEDAFTLALYKFFDDKVVRPGQIGVNCLFYDPDSAKKILTAVEGVVNEK